MPWGRSAVWASQRPIPAGDQAFPNPNHKESHNNLGNATQGSGSARRSRGAMANTRYALRPGYPEAHLQPRQVFLDQSRTRMAVRHYRRRCVSILERPHAQLTIWPSAETARQSSAEAAECYGRTLASGQTGQRLASSSATCCVKCDRPRRSGACFRAAHDADPQYGDESAGMGGNPFNLIGRERDEGNRGPLRQPSVANQNSSR